MTKSHLSQQAHDRLSAELEERSTVRRREISDWIERAREHGDLSENADYDAAKNEQAHNEARVRHIQDILKNAVVVDSAVEADVVAAGCVVELRFEPDEETVEYLVGSIEERHEHLDVLSTASPLGQAVLGEAPGARKRYDGPRGEIVVEVVGVRPPS
jgi:transcription elongation factor GreA